MGVCSTTTENSRNTFFQKDNLLPIFCSVLFLFFVVVVVVFSLGFLSCQVSTVTRL